MTPAHDSPPPAARPGPPAPAPAAGARLLVQHDTEYEYSTQVAFAQHLAYLQPLQAPGQQVAQFALEIEPAPARVHSRADAYGNTCSYFSVTLPHTRLHVRTSSRVTVQPRFDGLDPERSPPWERVRDALRFVAGASYDPASEFCFASPFVPLEPALRDYAQPSFAPGAPLLAGALDLMRRIHRDFRYEAGSTDVDTTVLEAFGARAGVCQDFSHLMICGLRSLGLPARYVSGYLHTRAAFAPLAGAAAREAPVVGADASHAWVAVHCPVNGWVEFDPTNDAIAGTGHVRLASGRDYGDVAPLRGVVQGGGAHRLRVAVAIRALEQGAAAGT